MTSSNTERKSRPEDRPIAADAGLPPRGACNAGGSHDRYCARVVKGDVTDADHEVCGAPATLHIIWEDTTTGVESGFACPEHGPEVRERWSPLATHLLGAYCGMPGSAWDSRTNTCVYPDDLPTAEPVRVVAVEVPS